VENESCEEDSSDTASSADDCGLHNTQDDIVVTPTQYPSKLMSPQCRFVPADRLGARAKLQDEKGYLYSFKYSRKNSDYYVCKDMFRHFCRSRAVYCKLDGGFIASIEPPHTHEPNKGEKLAALTERAVIDSFVDNSDTQPARPNDLIVKVVRNLEKSEDPSAILHVSKKEAIRGRYRRALIKKNVKITQRLPKTWAAMRRKGFPKELTTLASGAQFLR